MNSPYNRIKNRKKNNISNFSINPTHTTNEKTKNIKKSDLKGGSVLENKHQEDNTKFISIARRMVDKVKVFHSLNGKKRIKKETR